VSARLLRAVPASEEHQPATFEALVRPEFCVDLYLPPRANAWLYGPHCSVNGCERPGNELIVDHARLCQRHAQRFKQGQQGIDDFLARAPAVAARSELTGLARYDLTSESPVTRIELRLLMQTLHDGAHSVTFSSKRWNALRAIYATSEAESLLDIDLVAQPAHRVATGSAKRFKQYLAEVRDRLADREPSWRDDVWTRALYGSFAHKMQGRPPVQMDFTAIRQPWLREAAKEVAWQRITVEGITPGVAWNMVQEAIRFADWAGADRLRTPGDVTRALLVEWLIRNKRSHPPRSVSQGLSRLRLFLNHARILGLVISTDATYLPGELAIRAETEKPPRYFDDSELAQLDAPTNQVKLNDYNRRAYQVLRHTGMRQRSLVHIAFDCLVEAGGAFYLRFFNTKHRGGPQEHTIPISPELAAVIGEQQEWVRNFWPAQEPTWLFPARNSNPTGDRPAHPGAIYNALVAWVRDCGIAASDGQKLHFWPHRLRHSLGTEMINQGVPQHAIQEFYGHSSPEMTAHYAKLHDQTLRREFDAFLDRVNRRGERVDVLPAAIAPDAVILKERLARAKQSLPNGYCGIPVQQTCPHPNACLSCDGFLTDETFRPALLEQRQRAQALADSAVAEGHERLAQINLADVAALDTILYGLDELRVEPDEEFDVRDLGAA
jgi:integrase